MVVHRDLPKLTKEGERKLGLDDLASEMRRAFGEIDSNYVRTLLDGDGLSKGLIALERDLLTVY